MFTASLVFNAKERKRKKISEASAKWEAKRGAVRGGKTCGESGRNYCSIFFLTSYPQPLALPVLRCPTFNESSNDGRKIRENTGL